MGVESIPVTIPGLLEWIPNFKVVEFPFAKEN